MHIKEKILAMQADWKEQQAEKHHERLRKTAHKKHQQKRKGWPSDKSPI